MSESEDSMGMSVRQDVLQSSLFFERSISIYLATLLGVIDPDKSKSFGNSGSSLSFNSKVELLIDIGALPADIKKGFQKFMEIRNQFIHNFSANTYENCFDVLDDGVEKFLTKKYPQSESLSREERLKKVFQDLALELLEVMKSLNDKVKKKFESESRLEMTSKIIDAIDIEMSRMELELNSFCYNGLITKPDSGDLVKENLGSKVKKDLIESVKRRMQELTGYSSVDAIK